MHWVAASIALTLGSLHGNKRPLSAGEGLCPRAMEAAVSATSSRAVSRPSWLLLGPPDAGPGPRRPDPRFQEWAEGGSWWILTINRIHQSLRAVGESVRNAIQVDSQATTLCDWDGHSNTATSAGSGGRHRPAGARAREHLRRPWVSELSDAATAAHPQENEGSDGCQRGHGGPPVC